MIKQSLKLMAVLLFFVGIFVACNAHAVVEPEENDMQEKIRNPDEIVMCMEHNGVLDYAVQFTLKPQADKNYLATEDHKIKALILKHSVEFRQSFPGSSSTFCPELLPYYTLTIRGSCMCDESKEAKEIREKIIKDFLSTGKFEDDFMESEIAYTINN
jgi:superoxide dismutase